MPTITKQQAIKLAEKAGIDFNKSSFQQKLSAMSEVAALAKLAGYRKPKTASGSTGRYFFDHLSRIKFAKYHKK